MTAEPSTTHLVLIPSFDSGSRLAETVRDARAHWRPVWVVVDGSTDGSDAPLDALAAREGGIRVIRRAANGGKGAAVLDGLRAAKAAGFTHVLTMDADGQHPAAAVSRFMAASAARPDALVLGVPTFEADAPRLRVQGRRVSNWWANLETGWRGIADSLFGFRVYPVADLLAVMEGTRFMRRFDFDPEAAVRLAWRGLPLVNIPAAVRYYTREQGGVSHFNYLRDNALLAWMHARLVCEGAVRLLGRPGPPAS